MSDEENEIPKGFTRVTEVISTFNDFGFVSKEVLEAACERGTLVHDMCELYALDMLIMAVPPHVKGYVDCFKEWFDNYVTEVILTETRLNDDGLKLTGKIDYLLKMKGSNQLVILDIKTPVSKSKTWQLQTSAYQKLLDEVKGIKVDRRVCLMLSNEGKPAKIIEYTSEKDIEIFMKAFEVHKFFKES